MFNEKNELVRYIPVKQRMSTGYPNAAAFVEPGPPATQRNNKYLSVNNLVIEDMQVIAGYYRNVFHDDGKELAVTVHKISEYNSNGRKAGATIRFNRKSSSFEFAGSAGYEPAYRHRPVLGTANRGGSQSHCGVEFIRAFSEQAERKFSRRMAMKRFHLR